MAKPLRTHLLYVLESKNLMFLDWNETYFSISQSISDRHFHFSVSFFRKNETDFRKNEIVAVCLAALNSRLRPVTAAAPVADVSTPLQTAIHHKTLEISRFWETNLHFHFSVSFFRKNETDFRKNEIVAVCLADLNSRL